MRTLKEGFAVKVEGQPEINKMLQKLAFGKGLGWGGTNSTVVRKDDLVLKCENLQFQTKDGIRYGTNMDFPIVSLEEAIKILSIKKRIYKPKNFSVNVTPETSEMIQKICINKGFKWGGWDGEAKVCYTNAKILQVWFDAKNLFYTDNNAPPRVSLNRALEILEKYNGT